MSLSESTYKVNPTGFRIKIDPDIHIYEGSIALPPELIEAELNGTTMGTVVDIGPDVYDPEKFKAPYCKIGDIVHFKQYDGVAVKETINGNEDIYLFIIDENVYGVRDYE